MTSPPLRGPAEPASDCRLCERLAAYRDDNAARQPDWHNGPVPSFGDSHARLLIVGLAPGLSGANRTGRPFTGDHAGDLLYGTLLKFGLANGVYAARPDDGLTLRGCQIANAVRCAPPENKPTGAEIAACRPFLSGKLASLPNLRVILALGRIAHDSTVRALGQNPSRHVFRHAARHEMLHDGRRLVLFDSYHCSRYNTSTGRLTERMFHDVFATITSELEAG